MKKNKFFALTLSGALALTTGLICNTSTVYAHEHGAKQNGTKQSFSDNTLADVIFGGDLNVQLRYRYQFLDVQGFENDAHASTIRALVKYETKPIYGVSLLGEVRNVQRLGNGRLFNDSINGVSDRPTIADPDALEIDQAFIRLNDIIPETEVSVGRRKIALNNQRFISTLPFRQNANSFDGFVIENTSLPNTTLHYSYAFNFNRAFTDDSPSGNFDEADFNLFHAEHTFSDALKLVGYGYLLGIEDDSFSGAERLATDTFGVNAKGKYVLDDTWSLHYDLEYANQVENADNSENINLNYYRIVPGISYKNFRVNVGYEVLEGDGNIGFSTPLALLHAFNGFADVFVNTPTNGLEDRYINATYWFRENSGVKIGGYDVLKNTSFHVAYHDFSAENDGTDFGSEIDVSIKKKFGNGLTLVFEYANFQTDNDVVTSTSAAFERDVNQFYTALIYNF